MELLIQNGTVVNETGRARADVLVRGGRVAAVGEGLSCAGVKRIDAAGCFVLPGFIDTHTHFDLDTGSARTADDFITGGRAAILGGTTAVLDFATQDRGGTLKEAFAVWQEKARGCSCNYGFHMAIAEWNARTEAELPEMTRLGVTSYKLYMVYDALRVDDGAIYAALKAAKREGALIGVHCENWDVLNRRIAEVKAAAAAGPPGIRSPAPRPWRRRPWRALCALPSLRKRPFLWCIFPRRKASRRRAALERAARRSILRPAAVFAADRRLLFRAGRREIRHVPTAAQGGGQRGALGGARRPVRSTLSARITVPLRWRRS